MKKKMIINILVLLLFSSLVMAQSSSSTISKVGTGVAQFLKIGISARSIGMGEAFTGWIDNYFKGERKSGKCYSR